jgi:hypothetical protein
MTMLTSTIPYLYPPCSNLLRTRSSTSSCPRRKKSRRGTWSHEDDNGGDECIVPNESSHLHCLTSVSIAQHLMEDILYLLAFHVSSCGLPRVSPQLCQQTPLPLPLLDINNIQMSPNMSIEVVDVILD